MKLPTFWIWMMGFGLLFPAFSEVAFTEGIGPDDVRLRQPDGFPKPVYDIAENPITPEKFILGRRLFYDPILSLDSSTSCASCHQRFAAFAHVDHRLSHGIGGAIGRRNVPPIQNVLWQTSFMWDGGINHLDVQPLAPITNPAEMGDELKNVLQKLQNHPHYSRLFKDAFGSSDVSTAKLTKAISAFVALMVSDSSRYDRHMRGEVTFNEQEEKGLVLFRQHCASCHREPLFTDNTFRNNGLLPDSSLADMGRAAISGRPEDNFAFRVPSLRNIEVTYPYMHDGRFNRLRQVIDHYGQGHAAPSGTDLLVQQMPAFTDVERADLIAFLKTLTDRSFLFDDRFADPGGW